MNDIVKTSTLLPENIEDLSRFVLVNEERVQALRAQIRAIKKVNLAKDVYEQKLAEAQEIGEIVVEAGRKMGELLLTIQKQSGKRTDLETSPIDTDRLKTKSEITSEMGMTSQQVSQYQQMAQNPEAVQKAIEKAIENGDVVSRAQVMKEIRALKEEMRKKEESARSLERSMTKEYNELQEKYTEQSIQFNSLKESLNRTPENSRLEEDAETFIITTYNFIKRNGGFVWVAERVSELPEEKLKEFKNAVYAMDAFSKQMVNNIGGYDID